MKLFTGTNSGFTLPFEHWLRGELRAEVEGTLQRYGLGPAGGRC